MKEGSSESTVALHHWRKETLATGHAIAIKNNPFSQPPESPSPPQAQDRHNHADGKSLHFSPRAADWPGVNSCVLQGVAS